VRDPGQRFPDRFMLVAGILIGVSLGQVALAASDELAATQTAPPPAPKAVATALTGPQVYNAVCIACHAPPGLGGAPALGDSDAWAARIDRGMNTLIDNALNGYSGSTGIMPRRGGRLDLSDAEVIRAVEYMVEQASP
jgi:S-disulfanyl-L-cysteine oxidoreductase SoxD